MLSTIRGEQWLLVQSLGLGEERVGAYANASSENESAPPPTVSDGESILPGPYGRVSSFRLPAPEASVPVANEKLVDWVEASKEVDLID